MNMSDQEDAILVRLHMRYTMVYRIPSHMAMLIVKSCVRISRQTEQYHRQIRASLTQQKEQPSSVQIPLSLGINQQGFSTPTVSHGEPWLQRLLMGSVLHLQYPWRLQDSAAGVHIGIHLLDGAPGAPWLSLGSLGGIK